MSGTGATAVRGRTAPRLPRRLVDGPLPVGIVALVLWEFGVRAVGSSRVLPPPSEIVVAWVGLLGKEFYWESLRITLTETLLGFALGSVVGVLLGIGLGAFRLLRQALFPIVVTLELLPRIALAPVFLAWFGFGMTSKVALAATLCFFPVVLNTLAAYDNYDADRMTVMRVLGASRWQTTRMARIPEALPAIFSGLRVAVTLALLGAIVAEFVAAEEGVGPLIHEYTFQIAVPQVFALVLSLGVVGLLLYSVVLFIERRVTYWARFEP